MIAILEVRKIYKESGRKGSTPKKEEVKKAALELRTARKP